MHGFFWSPFSPSELKPLKPHLRQQLGSPFVPHRLTTWVSNYNHCPSEDNLELSHLHVFFSKHFYLSKADTKTSAQILIVKELVSWLLPVINHLLQK